MGANLQNVSKDVAVVVVVVVVVVAVVVVVSIQRGPM